MSGRFVGLPVGALALFMLAPLLCAFLLQEGSALVGFLVAILIAVFFAVSLLLALQNRKSSMEDRTRTSLFPQLLGVWFLLPVFAAVPFFLGGGLDAVSAYFEAVSALTTTGASVLSADGAARSLLLWRALLQWLGGLASLIMIAVFLQPMKLVEMGEGAVVLPHRSATTPIGELRQVSLLLLMPYTLLSALCFLGLVATGLPGFHALCMSLSLISTGGFVSSETLFPGPAAMMLMILFMLLGAFNFSCFCAVMRGNFRFSRAARGLAEIRLLLLLWLVAAVGLILVFHHSANHDGANWLNAVMAGLFASASLISTTAMPIPASDGGEYGVPLPLLLLLPIIGGCCFSTAGGIRLARILLLVRHSWRELERLIHPSSVVAIPQDVSPAGMRTVWACFGAFVLLLALGTILLTFNGVGFLPALTAAVAALANAGPLLLHLDPAVLGSDSYGGMGVFAKSVLIVLMVAGRVEILLLLGMLLPAWWRE